MVSVLDRLQAGHVNTDSRVGRVIFVQSTVCLVTTITLNGRFYTAQKKWGQVVQRIKIAKQDLAGGNFDSLDDLTPLVACAGTTVTLNFNFTQHKKNGGKTSAAAKGPAANR